MRVQRLLPKSLEDCASPAILVFMIPVMYWFEMFIVLPLYFGENHTAYILHCVFGTFLLINVVGNYIGVYLIDPSIKGKFLSSEMKPTWKFCAVCECITPPRSWHCDTCNICILKRDHHCSFTSSCVGHSNHRYFLMFLFYFSVAAIYCSYFNIFYLWNYTPLSFFGLFKVVLPLAAFLVGGDTLSVQIHRLICSLSFLAMLAGTGIFIYHLNNVRRGRVSYENGKNLSDYDLGSIKDNFIQVLGKRWYLTLVSPFAQSELPCDGIHWDKIKQTTSKAK